MATTINEIKLLYDQYSSFLSAQILDNTITAISALTSGKLDACKLLMLLGTGNETTADYAQLSAGYFRMSVPITTTLNTIISDFNTNNPDRITLSSHFSNLNKNSNFVSDIIKLDFILPVPTSARVILMLSNLGDQFLSFLKYHNTWNTNDKPVYTYPTWLDGMPHRSLFVAVSTYIDTSLSNHNIAEDAHQNRFKNYYDINAILNIVTILNNKITTLENRAKASETNINTQLYLCSSAISSVIEDHFNATNLPGYLYAHNEIFEKYDRIPVINQKITNAKNELYNRINVHCINGITLHKDLAPKLNPYLLGNIYLNYINDDNNNHGLYIKVGKNDYCRLGSYQTTSTIDNGGLAIQTADNGSEPIVVLQYNGQFVTLKNRAYILDSNGNTSFPNNTTIGKDLTVTGNLYANGNFIYANKIDATSINTNRRSYTYLENLSLNDSSKIIPNTEWVQNTITKRANLFCIVQTNKLDDRLYAMLTPNITAPTNNSTTQILGYTKNITINPSRGRIIANIFLSPNALITTINNQTINSNTANITTLKVSGTSTFLGNSTFNQNVTINNKLIVQNQTTLNNTLDVAGKITANSSLTATGNGYFANNTVKLESNKITCNEFIGISNKARWADLAEIYLSDKEYLPGTLIQFGGEKLITIAKNSVNGVISENPAYLMNSNYPGQKIALVGRVNVRVKGKVNKFDYITLSDLPGIGISNGNNYTINTIARALLSKEQELLSAILCVIQMHI